jgi:hypothetical protein
MLQSDGAQVEPGVAVAQVVGDAGSIFKAERTALNFLQRLSAPARSRPSCCWSAPPITTQPPTAPVAAHVQAGG